jgi:hypothetical protein
MWAAAMNQLTSAEFRKSYPRLTEAVEVTALGRVIGVYTPSGAVKIAVTYTSEKASSQKDRDAILRRINRAG